MKMRLWLLPVGLFVVIGFILYSLQGPLGGTDSALETTASALAAAKTVDVSVVPTASGATATLAVESVQTPVQEPTASQAESIAPTFTRAVASPGPAATETVAPGSAPSETPEPTSQPVDVPAHTPPPSLDSAIVVDHYSVDDFERIPEAYIEAAAALRMVYIDRSVGNNINDALDCLSYASIQEAPNHCSRIQHVEPNFSVSPNSLSWNRSGGYPRGNWEFRGWEGNCTTWQEKVSCFITMIDPVLDQYDVVSFQYSYLHITEDSTIADQPGGFFSDNPDVEDVYDLEAYEAQHPDKTFIYWTTSLARGIGTAVGESFNSQMRQYAIENGKALFDVADILSHDPDGNPCYDNRDGVPYDNGNNSEDHPDDGQNFVAICPHYTTETDGGHLGAVSAGKIRVAKAFWVLMARIAGWDGSST